jgi:signal transduction histidine kinase
MEKPMENPKPSRTDDTAYTGLPEPLDGASAEALLLQKEDNLRQVHSRLQELQEQLLQSEKMASIGQLAAGVAHEINNPIGYVYSNLGSLQKYLDDLFSLVEAYESYEPLLAQHQEAMADIRAVKEKVDLEFLRQDVNALMGESREGITRVKKIVQNLKDFSHAGSDDDWQWSNLHQGLDSTLSIVWNEIKYKAEVKKEYGEIPDVECLPSQLNQVFMNLLVNAAHAIEDKGTITIRTGTQDDGVWVEVSDSGNGIAPEHLNRIFEPFFTTKPVGKGTGLGLSVSYSIIQTHHGNINVASKVGEGTTFRIWLPVKHAEAKDAD